MSIKTQRHHDRTEVSLLRNTAHQKLKLGMQIVGALRRGTDIKLPDLPGFHPRTAAAALSAAIGARAELQLSPEVGGIKKITQRERARSLQPVHLRELAETDPEAARALLREWHPKLEKAYPGVGEIESTAVWEQYLFDKNDTWDVILLKDGDQIVGGLNTHLLETEDQTKFGVIEHFYLADSHSHLGAQAVALAKQDFTQQGAKYAFIEMNDPRIMDAEKLAEDVPRPAIRADNTFVMGAYGFRQCDAPYMQSAFEGEDPVRHLELGCMVLDGASPDAIDGQTYLSVIRAFFTSFANLDAEAVLADETYQRIVANTPPSVELTAFDQPRRHVQPLD